VDRADPVLLDYKNIQIVARADGRVAIVDSRKGRMTETVRSARIELRNKRSYHGFGNVLSVLGWIAASVVPTAHAKDQEYKDEKYIEVKIIDGDKRFYKIDVTIKKRVKELRERAGLHGINVLDLSSKSAKSNGS